MAEKIRIDTTGNGYLSGFLSVPKDNDAHGKTLVMMLHGFPGDMHSHNNLFAELETQLTAKGAHVLRFNFQGAGESSGTRENFSLRSAMRDLDDAKSWAKEHGFKNFLLIGEGLGATVAIQNAAQHMDIRALCLLWPVFDAQRYSENFLKTQNSVFGPEMVEDLLKLNLVPALKEIFMPTHIVYATEDPDIPPDQVDVARDHLRAKRLEITIFHEGHVGLTQKNHRQSMFYHLSQFVARQTGPEKPEKPNTKP